MAISTSCLFHFTDSKESLLGILTDNFRIYSCRETIVLEDNENSYHVPMVSFCDIPLSQIKEHISKYGCYGIGLDKDWGLRKKLNPVLYISSKSMIAESYNTVLGHYASGDDKEIDDFSREELSVVDFLRYTKQYEGKLIRKGKLIDENYRFADEREWRYVPSIAEDCERIVLADWYEIDDENKAATDKKLDGLRLAFDPNDIRYIIIRDDTEINDFVDHLKKVKGRNYTLFDIDRLTTRILTFSQINNDM